MKKTRNLEPSEVWNFFEDINAIPRGSKKEEKISKFIKDFGGKLNLETYQDSFMNVIIKKPATKGFENRKTIILQSHLDMVHQKNNDINFDFDKDGINSYADGDWVKAKGTTLGADNGLGVAYMMALLESKNIEHPNIECLFTIDEETGMTGAKNLEKGKLKGTILLNLDTEDIKELTIGCAGGIDINVNRNYSQENSPSLRSFKINIKGLKGGHSGMEIHLGRGNSNKIITRFLVNSERFGLRLSELNGGGLRNAIPREAEAIVFIEDVEGYMSYFKDLCISIKSELSSTEPDLDISIKEISHKGKTMEQVAQELIINSLNSCFNGVFRMSADVKDLVETSSNLANVIIKDGVFQANCLTRSSVESAKMDCANSIKSSFKNSGCKVEFTGGYPGWKPNPDSEILKILESVYNKIFNQEPNVTACHAGLECGIISGHYPGLDMVSIGPTIVSPHSPDERVNIKSVSDFWIYLKEILKNIPNK